jgi:hypothetical protein
MQGGVLSKVKTLKTTIEYDMSFILSNSTLEVLSHGAYGFACKVIMNPGIPSGFIDEDGTPVTTFIIKLVPLEMLMAHKDGKWSRSSTMEKFTLEVSLQRKVYKESLRKHAYAPCPALLHHVMFTVGKLNTLLPGEFSYGFLVDGNIIETENKTLRVGVIFMEFSSSSQGTLDNAVKRGHTTLEERQGEATRLYCMALECGVNHRDAHPKNFLIDDKGRLKLIDFGIAKQITKEEKEETDVVSLIPHTASNDCEELRDELKRLYKEDAWFLREPFSIDSYTTKVAKEAVRGSTEGLREITPHGDTRKRRAEVEKIIMETKAQKLYQPSGWRLDSDLGTTEQDKQWAIEREEIKIKELNERADFIIKDHYHQIKGMSPEELAEFRIRLISDLRRQDEEDEDEDASGGRRQTKRRKTKRTRRKRR